MLLPRNHLSNSENDDRFRRDSESLAQTRSCCGLIGQDPVVKRTVNRKRHAMKTVRRDPIVSVIPLVFVAYSEEEIYFAQHAGQKESLREPDVPRTRVKKLTVCCHQD